MTTLPSDSKECLSWLLEFAQQPFADYFPPDPQSPKPKRGRLKDFSVPDPKPSVMAAAQAGIEHFIGAARPDVQFGFRLKRPLTGAELRKLYSRTSHGVREVARGSTWDVPANQLSAGFGLAAGAGWLDYDGDTCDQFLLTCLDLLRREGKLISKCARNGCGALFVRARRARYCGKRCGRLAEAARERKRQGNISPAQKTTRRRSYYLARLKRYEPAHWRHLRDAHYSVARAIRGIRKVSR